MGGSETNAEPSAEHRSEPVFLAVPAHFLVRGDGTLLKGKKAQTWLDTVLEPAHEMPRKTRVENKSNK